MGFSERSNFLVEFFLMENENGNFLKLFWGTMSFCLVFIFTCVAVFIFLPSNSNSTGLSVTQVSLGGSKAADKISDEDLFSDEALNAKVSTLQARGDEGLTLYRQTQSRAAVEWFYTHVTNNREVALAILDEAEKNNIPLSLAFSLAHTESLYKVTAINYNTNNSIDRGLFQLNNMSFPNLTEADFYNAKISAKYGLSHLRFCLTSAGNEIAALAMYNAGTNKVRNNNTPQRTLNYISQIENYRSTLEDNFAVEVLAFYEVDDGDKLLAQK